MAEKTPTLSPENVAANEVYQPLSMLAVASFVIAGGYALVIGVLGLVAFFTGEPLFLRIETILIAALGAALAYGARRQIRVSEGVLSGTLLTTWALWLAAVAGLGYAAYYFGTYFAVTWQARNFTSQWIDKVRNGQLTEAFLETQEPGKRKTDKPNDPEYMYQRYGQAPMGRKGPLPQFQESDFIGQLQAAAKNGSIQSLGIRSWEYQTKGYKVQELYEVTNLYGKYEAQITVASSQGPEIEGRKWQVDWNTTGTNALRQELTPLGRTLEQWRLQSRQFGGAWVGRRYQGDLLDAYWETLPAAERPKPATEHQWLASGLGLALKSLGGGPAAGLVNLATFISTDAARAYTGRGFQEFLDGSLVRTDGFVAPRALRDEIATQFKKSFMDRALVTVRSVDAPVRVEPVNPDPVNPDQAQYRMLMDVELGYLAGPTAQELKYSCDATLVVESDRGPVTPERKPRWRIAELRLIRGGVPPAPSTQGKGPGQAPAAPRP